MQKIAHSTVALSHHLKIRDNCYCQEQFSSLTGTDGSWKTRNRFEAVNLYKKNKKKHIKPRQNFTGSYKKSVEILDELQDAQSIKS